MSQATPFSDFIVFVDESGTAVLENPDPTFPVFVLNCVLVRKTEYAQRIAPSTQQLKFDFVGHDQLVLHERDIRRQQNDFAFLRLDETQRGRFIERINAIVREAPMDVAAAVINKVRLAAKYADPWSPYELGLHFCMETLLSRLKFPKQEGSIVHVLFESRGRTEDKELELKFRRIVNNEAQWGWKAPDFTVMRWEPLFIEKKSNSPGLQLADLMARPIGLKCLRPTQPNRAYDHLRPKLAFGGMKQFP